MRTKFYIYVIPEYRVPWLDIYKYPLPNRLMILCIPFLMECTCPSHNLISDLLLCFLIPFSEIVSFVSYQKGLFQYFVKSRWQVWICFHFICMLLLCLCLLNKHFRIIIILFNAQFYPRRDEGIYNFTRNIYKLNNVHKSNRQRHSNNIQIKWKQISC
jgi:hypothetical protein